MELIITIPKEFEAHFKQDKFKDSLGRICYDIENAFKKHEGVSGRYEHELAEMLDDAFAKAQVSQNEAKLKRALWLAREKRAQDICDMADVCVSALEANKVQKVWQPIANKCRAYADKFKE